MSRPVAALAQAPIYGEILSTSGRKFIANKLFRQRALAEAARYGSDPWVLVRELLQNARDADAQHVAFTVSDDGTRQRLVCRDDGSGMSFEHARRYLFSLYASSKEDQSAQAGKFGIGFWSVLRFAPTTLVIRSRVDSQPAWEVTLDGELEWATAADTDLGSGTEIVLERASDRVVDLAEKVHEAARHYGRFLTRGDGSGKPLRVTVDNRGVNENFSLPAPCATFAGKGFRGVVGLGPEPRVELFAHGLFVRSADSLQDLRALGEPSATAGAEDALAELPALAPQVLLDGAELDLMLARGDARQDKNLQRMLRAAERALDRLISRQLQALRPQPWYRAWLGAFRDRLEPLIHRLTDSDRRSQMLAVAAGAVVLFAMGAVIAALFFEPASSRASASDSPRSAALSELGADTISPTLDSAETMVAGEFQGFPSRTGGGEDFSAMSEASAGLTPSPVTQSYADLGRRYHGPHPGRLEDDRSAVDLTYRPATRPALFNALVVAELRGTRWQADLADRELSRYRGDRCRDDCLEIELRVSTSHPMRIPVPTGHRLDPTSLTLDGAAVQAFETEHGEAVLALSDGARGLLEYRTGLAPTPGPRSAEFREVGLDPVPQRFDVAADMLRVLPVRERVSAALDFVTDNIVYDRSPDKARVYLANSGRSFVETALETGAGDCDVQNGVLVELLRRAGVEARLALGYVGVGGTVSPGLHAWVEYFDEGYWLAADASAVTEGLAPVFADQAADVGGRLQVEVLTGLDGEKPPAWRTPVAVGALVLLTLGVAGLMAQRRSDTGLELDPAGDLAALLGGALRHPGAFNALPTMAHGRFVPLLGDAGMISIDRARRLASKGQLFRSSTGSRLARQAVEAGTPVVDAETAEGRVLSLALGAVDLDHWSDLHGRAVDSGISRWMNLQLEVLGVPWRMRSVQGLGDMMTELALEDLGLGRRLILIDPGHTELAPATRHLPDRPETAAFTAFDLVVRRLDLGDRESARILAASAGRAITEAHP